MTSLKQIEANRRNAGKSTGPKSESGKRRARRNALRHGLAAETVIAVLEDPDDYRAFEAAVVADYDARGTVEQELVLRLASLLWRLRRATAIESGLLAIQSELLRDAKQKTLQPQQAALRTMFGLNATGDVAVEPQMSRRAYRNGDSAMPRDKHNGVAEIRPPVSTSTVAVARCFLRLANLDNGAFDRVIRYEAALWRQVRQIGVPLTALRRRTTLTYHRPNHQRRSRMRAG